MEILAVIPARKNSKSIKDKNIKLINGKPMLAYSIEHAQNSELITRIILDTDSEDYANIGRKYGAETPFIRPACLAEDLTNDYEVFSHLVNWLKANEDYTPQIIVQLRPTYPYRNSNDIDEMINVLTSDPNLDSVRSVTKANEIPYKMWTINSRNILTPIVYEVPNIQEPFNEPRQKLPEAYIQNAAIDIFWTKTIVEQQSMTGKNIYGYVMNHNLDIDYENEFLETEKLMSFNPNEKKTFCFDIDGVIMGLTPNNDYNMAKPILETVELINNLFDSGHHIIINTARGYVTGIDWSEVTKNQFRSAGLKYHELYFSKPAADYYIDDKNKSVKEIKQMYNQKI
jgi:CMP-N,N'-diacetyllegionaminic acid synthase